MHNDKKNKNNTPREPLPEEEIVIQDEGSEDQAPGAQPEPQEVEADGGDGEPALLTEKYNDLNDRYLRLIAEYDNFRKRSQKERDEIYPAATAAAVGKFLPVLDNFERAAAFPHGDDEFGKGFDKIYQGFQEVLTSLGVEPIGEPGEPFDPAVHNAIMHIEDESLGENVISQVLQKGYRIGDRIIRHAMVQTAN